MLPQSKIFDEYAKIATDKGIVKQADKQPVKEAAEDDTAKSIALLYGVKPNGKEDDKHIMEKAHPGPPVAAARAYDAMNAIVEDNFLRNEIMTWIAEKVPNGQVSMKRYIKAHNALLKSLVNIGFTTDNEGQEGLQKLADACANQLTKEGFVWGKALSKALVWLVPAAFFAWIGLEHAPEVAVTVSNNAQRVLEQLAKLKGHEDVEDIEAEVMELKRLADLWQSQANRGGQLRNAIRSNPDLREKVYSYVGQMSYSPVQTLPAPIRITIEYLGKLDSVAMLITSDWLPRVKSMTVTQEQSSAEYEKLRWVYEWGDKPVQEDLISALDGLNRAIEQAKEKIHGIVRSGMAGARGAESAVPEAGGGEELLPAYAQLAKDIIGKDG